MTSSIFLGLLVMGSGLQEPPRLAPPVGPGVAGQLPTASRASLEDTQARPHMFADPSYYHWGGTPILADDGLYHIFYDRWPRSNPRGMYGWLYITEIAHATSAKPEGPYVFRNVAISSPGDNPPGRWDAVNTHNACITRFPDPATGKPRYYLYFIANRGRNSTSDPWMVHISNQRIGVAWSDSPDGPWTRHPEPVCIPNGALHHYVVNPGVTRLPDGRYLMVLKGRGYREEQPEAWGPMLHGWALADKPTGPFTIQESLLFPSSISAEDPCVWMQDGRVFAAVKDWSGKLSGVAAGISWIYGDLQPNGSVKWTVPNSPLVSPRALRWDDGTETKIHALERPFILLDATGQPSHLFAAACLMDEFEGSSQTPRTNPPPIKPENLPFNVCIPLVRPARLTTTNFHDSLVPKGFVLTENDWHIWCNAPIYDERGALHLFVSRWPVKDSFGRGWHTSCEIAHYKADKPEGPYTFVRTVLKGTGVEGSWRKDAPHNVTVLRIPDGRYAMLFIANSEGAGRKFPTNQKIGMMLASNLDGPWTPVGRDGLILDVPDEADIWSHQSVVGVNNPTLLPMPDGRFLLYYKAMKPGKGQVRRMGVAVAHRVEGPYRFEKEPLTNNEGTIEDGFAFLLNGEVALLVTDCHGQGLGGGMIYCSKDGLRFESDPLRAYEAIDHYMPRWPDPAPGWTPWVLQRPALLLDSTGKPTHLFAPCGTPPEGQRGTATFLFEIQPGKGTLK